jgi:prepilin signal peptidase PulO-like enzyme (type II secretory pathway)
MKNKLYLLLITLLFSLAGIAQEAEAPVEMADAFRSEGKIYVVIAVLSIIFICLIGYLIYIDLKLKKLENKN